jgi:transposase
LNSWQHEQLKNLSSIPGLGKRGVALLIVYTDGFRKISNYRQLIALAGLAPREHTSGSSVRGRKGICKMGNGHLRNVLYMCAMTAIKYNKACKDLYERLRAKGKNGKVALIAVCNKLLKQAFAIAIWGTVYNADYCSQLN